MLFATSSCTSALRKRGALVKDHLLRSCYNAFRNLQWQFRIENGSITGAFLRAAMPMHFVITGCKPSHNINQRSRRTDNGDDSALLPMHHFFIFSSFRYQSRPKVSHKCSEKHMFDQNRALATVSCTFLLTLRPAPATTQTLLFVKTESFTRARVSSPVTSHAPGLFHFQTT